jgi:hypothetical protein
MDLADKEIQLLARLSWDRGLCAFGPEVSAKIDAIDEIEWAVTSGPLTGAGLVEQTRSGPKAIARALAGTELHGILPKATGGP